MQICCLTIAPTFISAGLYVLPLFDRAPALADLVNLS